MKTYDSVTYTPEQLNLSLELRTLYEQLEMSMLGAGIPTTKAASDYFNEALKTLELSNMWLNKAISRMN